ncbi:hypothetical protein [Pseudaestuariivita atlantica]|uniref:Uncharacterized protein n=1 Tax=Pseudaestuariivita atlantica TaxID=1317121 RepID=A0A0L1JR68_9RHOB|nr:hypothetical protein [Pseudaestuariivita atlantica]KNG94235.1 hypothetical protein ATO11_08435 [Pseudaestuariivita atlantica]
MSRKETPFFVGYLPLPRGLGGFVALVSVALVALFAAAALLIGGTQDAPQDAAFRFDYGRQTVTGVVELTPYPLLRVTEGNDLIPPGKTLMMTAAGKSGVDMRAMGLEGKLAQVSGVVLERGTIDMIQLRGGRRGIQAAEGEAPAMQTEPLGRWRLAGEICDGKCLYGAMRPGRGLAHKACANLCIIGDVPPVFVTTQPVEGQDFMLITGPDGTRLPKEAYDFVGQFVTLEGDLERRGDVLVLRLDTPTIALVDG